MQRFIETQRLILRSPSKADNKQLPEILKIRNSPFVLRYNLYPVATRSDILREFEQIDCVLLIEKSTQKVIGCIYIKEDFLRYNVNSGELAGWISRDFAARGYMTEGLSALIGYLFENEGYDRLTARVFSPNAPSRKLMRKVGFGEEGYLKEAVKNAQGEIFDLVLYSLSKAEFSENERKVL